jgi:hypothetical protein
MTYVLASFLAASSKAVTITARIGSTTHRSSPPLSVLYSSMVTRPNTFKQLHGSFAAAAAAFSTKTDAITKEDVRALFGLWNDALATGDSSVVASRYAQGATLLPTVR